MLKIHVLDVKLGDSVILETGKDGESHYSVIDCKSIEDRTPTVEFLQERGIRHIQSLFLTHPHNDHWSGFPRLVEYLKAVRGTLEYFVSPQIPAELESWRKIIRMSHDQSASKQLTGILRAVSEIQKLPALTHPNKRTMSVRLHYEGDRGEHAWRTHLHPGLFFAPVSPTSEEAFRMIESAFEKARQSNKSVNAISHALLIGYDTNCRRHLGLLTGDLEGKVWRFVKNRCLNIAGSSIRTQLSFLKVPHHGARNATMEECLGQLIHPGSDFLASVSCPPADPKHPDKRTLIFLKNNFTGCCIACTNISDLCHSQGLPSVVKSLLEQSAREAEFLEFALSSRGESSVAITAGACAGDHTLTVTDGGCEVVRGTGLVCGFNAGGCENISAP